MGTALRGLPRERRWRDAAPRRRDAAAAALGGLLGVVLSAACGGTPSLDPGRLEPDVAAALEAMPADAWAVIGVRPARAQKVPALAAVLGRLPALPIDPSIAGACGLDPAARDGAIELAVAAVIGGAAGAPPLVVVAIDGGFTRRSIGACVAEKLTEADEPLVATDDGRLTTYGPRRAGPRGGGAGAGVRAVALWPTDDLLVLAPTAGARQALLALAGRTSGQVPLVAGAGAMPTVSAAGVVKAAPAPAPVPPPLVAMVDRVATGAAIWAAIRLPPSMRAAMASAGPGVAAVRGVFASLDAAAAGAPAGSIDLAIGLRLDSEDAAESFVDAIDQQKEALAAALPDPRAGAIVRRLAVSRTGAELAARATLSPAELDLVIQLAASVPIGSPR
jgi:hypothetical protein